MPRQTDPKTVNLDAALALIAKGYFVFPCFYVKANGACSCGSAKCDRVGKHPISKQGCNAASNDSGQILNWWQSTPYANIGLATGKNGIVVVDIDDGPDKAGSASLKELEANFGPLPETLTVTTGSGGRHLYFSTVEEIRNSQSKVGKHIDVRGVGGYVIVPPSNHKSGRKYAWDDARVAVAPAPAWLVTRMGTRIKVEDDTLDEAVVKDSKPDKISAEHLIKLLEFIPADCEREIWWKVGAGLKKELGDKAGFKAWDDWSSTAPDKYDARGNRRQWDSFEDKGITGGTIYKIAQENGFRGFDKEAADAKEIKDAWVYAISIKRFVELGRMLELDREQFDATYAPDFTKGKASDHVLRNPAFRRVDGVTYWPGKEQFVTEDRLEKINYWRSNGLTPVKGDVNTLVKHVSYLYPNPLESKILLDYLAFQVQHPGEKIHWALLLQGVQGNGKSYFGYMMRVVLGKHNVHMLNNETLHETFTGWQRNTQFVVVEELMARGRIELMNKLKPMITQPTCSVRQMYKEEYEQPNRFNFLLLTNHLDSIVVDKTDRRYCVLASGSAPHPGGVTDYYAPLFDWTRDNGATILNFLLERNLSEFHPQAHPPMTEGKRALIVESLPALDQFISDHVSSCTWPFRSDLSEPSAIVEVLNSFNLRANPKEVARTFERLGYLYLGEMRSGAGPSKNGNGNGHHPTPERINMWAVRNAAQYETLTPAQLRKIWIDQNNDDPMAAASEIDPVEFLKSTKPGNATKQNKPM